MEYWCAALHAEGLRPMKRRNDECNEGRTEEQKRGYYHMVIGQDSLFEIPKNKNRIPEFSCWQFFCSKLEARRPTNEWWCQERRPKLTRFRILDIASLTVRINLRSFVSYAIPDTDQACYFCFFRLLHIFGSSFSHRLRLDCSFMVLYLTDKI